MKILLDRIKDSPRPIRTSWDEDALNELAKSIAEQGVIVPIKVRMPDLAQHCWTMRDHGLTCIDAEQDRLDRVGNEDWGTCVPYCPWCQAVEWEEHEEDEDDPIPADWKPYEIVYGHRRVEAARRANLTEIEAIVEGVDDTAALIQAGIENIQREDMAPLDKARWLQTVIDETGWPQKEIDRRGLMPQATISWTLALLQEEPDIQTLIAPGSDQGETPPGFITPRHVRRARVPGLSPGDRAAVLRKAASENLPSEQTRAVAETVARTADPERRKALLETPYNQFVHNPEYAEANEQMARAAAPSPGEEFDRLPAIAVGLEAMKEFRKTMTLMLEACKVGKASPEARRFFARRIDGMIQFLTSIKEGLAE